MTTKRVPGLASLSHVTHRVHFLAKGNGKGAVFNRAFQTPQENHFPQEATAGTAVFTSVAG